MSQFVRVYDLPKQREVLLNVGMVWKIEISYAVPGEDNYYATTLNRGLHDENAVRIYRVFIGGEEHLIVGNPDDPIAKVFDEIYRACVKA